jgi:anti-sigma regulatory factor (Ser/Thr protein kinase)
MESQVQVARSFRAHPSALHKIRTFVGDLLLEVGLDESAVADLVLAVSEASANAILHTNTPTVEVTFRVGDDSILIQIEDDGVFRRRIPIPELDGRGRGIPLMMALVDEVSIREGTPGKPGTQVKLVKNR